MSGRIGRRRLLRAVGGVAATGVAGCLGGGDGGSTTTTADSPFPAGSCLARITGSLPDPAYGFEFVDGPDPEVGSVTAETSGDVTLADGVATFGEDGGTIELGDVTPVDDLTVSALARPAVAAEDEWNVMVRYSSDRQWAGWGLEHGKGQVDFWAEGPGDAETEVLTTSDSGLPVGEWTHVAGVKRGGTLELYVGGERAATSEFPHPEISYGGADGVDMAIGRHTGSGVGDRHYLGDIDALAVWDGALSPSEADDLVSTGSSCR